MSEYTDKKNRRHKVIQITRETKESHEIAEKEIAEALFRIFFPKASAK